MADNWLYTVNDVVWRVGARDPHRAREIGHLADDPEREAVAELALMHGLLLDLVVDDDVLGREPGWPDVAWWLVAPSSLHDADDMTALPSCVREVAKQLRARYPAFQDWTVALDETETQRFFRSSTLHAEYDDLIRVAEVALLPLRTPDMTHVQPTVRYWSSDDNIMIGAYSICLTKQPDGCALVAHVGIACPEALAGDNSAARRTGRVSVPLLVFPRPAEPLFFVQITRGTRLLELEHFLRQQPQPLPDLAADFRWVSRSPERLLNAVRDATSAWWPTRS